jgi:hypothetical protein
MNPRRNSKVPPPQLSGGEKMGRETKKGRKKKKRGKGKKEKERTKKGG